MNRRKVLAGLLTTGAALVGLPTPVNNVFPVADLVIGNETVTLFAPRPLLVPGFTAFYSLRGIPDVCADKPCFEVPKISHLYNQAGEGRSEYDLWQRVAAMQPFLEKDPDFGFVIHGVDGTGMSTDRGLR